mmetsp:Transcript_7753/g.15836  ORF Transcript_7753/g.15836 Transcript_7753/m.15836 type:complete len:219 (+) Transcript_7753:1185-1841(+)
MFSFLAGLILGVAVSDRLALVMAKPSPKVATAHSVITATATLDRSNAGGHGDVGEASVEVRIWSCGDIQNLCLTGSGAVLLNSLSPQALHSGFLSMSAWMVRPFVAATLEMVSPFLVMYSVDIGVVDADSFDLDDAAVHGIRFLLYLLGRIALRRAHSVPESPSCLKETAHLVMGAGTLARTHGSMLEEAWVTGPKGPHGAIILYPNKLNYCHPHARF